MSRSREKKGARSVSPEQEYELNPREEKDDSPVSAKTEAQGHYLLSMQSNTVTFGLGPAGTGKTYLAACSAAAAFAEKRVQKILITRPAIEAGESLGFLPGRIDEKFEPYFRPVRAVLERRLGKSHVEYLMKVGRIEALPLAYMRGHTFENAFVLFDEAQNATATQMKLFLTRVGNHSKVVVNGDVRQRDLLGANGLEDAVERLAKLRGVGVIEFSRSDIVRSGISQRIVEAYEK